MESANRGTQIRSVIIPMFCDNVGLLFADPYAETSAGGTLGELKPPPPMLKCEQFMHIAIKIVFRPPRLNFQKSQENISDCTTATVRGISVNNAGRHRYCLSGIHVRL